MKVFFTKPRILWVSLYAKIDKDGLHTSQSKVKAILDAQMPRKVTEVLKLL